MLSCDAINSLPTLLLTINGIVYPVPPDYYIQRVRGQRWGLAVKLGQNPWAAARRRAPSAGQVTPLQMLLSPCGWASASHKTNHVRVEGSLGHSSS